MASWPGRGLSIRQSVLSRRSAKRASQSSTPCDTSSLRSGWEEYEGRVRGHAHSACLPALLSLLCAAIVEGYAHDELNSLAFRLLRTNVRGCVGGMEGVSVRVNVGNWWVGG